MVCGGGGGGGLVASLSSASCRQKHLLRICDSLGVFCLLCVISAYKNVNIHNILHKFVVEFGGREGEFRLLHAHAETNIQLYMKK